ncbi:MAG: hypothetical protein BWY71_00013 [Planctomycetes bacterium ADurb.Bin412]|nr:MAG: hypothetical protein BWY71_00013 [Planctomycetes bacterium ADurb.Bin412]
MAHDPVGQQHLGHLLAVLAERLLILVHQDPLPDRRTSLPQLNLGNLAGESQAVGAHTDSPGGDQDDLPLLADQPGDLLGDNAEKVNIDAAVLAEHIGADLDDNPFGLGKIS